MADQKTFPVFAYVEEHVQLEDLREYLSKNGAKVVAAGSDDVAENLIEICGHLHVLSKLGEQATDFIISSVTSLIVTVAVDTCLPVVTAFCKAITPAHFKGPGPQSSAGYAVRALSNLYRGFSAHPKIQEVLYATLVDMCNEARLISALDCSVEDLEEYFAKWETNTDVRRHILRQVHVALLADGRADQAAKVMVMLLGTYTDDDAASAKDDATECVRTAVVDPKSFSFDHLQRLSAVKALRKSDPLMYSALELFINGTLKEYKEFVKSHPKFVTDKLKVDEAILVKKIRLLTLMTIAENNKVINLDELAQQLDLPADDVLEEFIIEAIQVNAISGKLNEMSRQLVVSSFQHRQFGRDQWVALQKRLQNLICNLKQAHSNVHYINESIEEAVVN